MQLSRFLFFVAFAVLPVCLVSTTWLYLYPLVHGCGFPVLETSNRSSTSAPPLAPFRLLALGDPQLEGDSSLPKPHAVAFPSLQYLASDLRNAGTWARGWYILRNALGDATTKDLPKWLEGYRKRIDLWGNDWYLAHIVRQLRWWTKPSHVAVLGDLLGSQWISDEEFARRADRYWGRVFKGMERVPDTVMQDIEEAEEQGRMRKGRIEVLGEDNSWENRVINIAGNHDIGYAGDLDEERVERFETAFGKVNWDITFTHHRTTEKGGDSSTEPVLRLVILNSMNLDTPAMVESLQRQSYDFMNHIITTSRPVTDKTHMTILLTHIPLHKESGVCVDSPFFDFFEGGSGVKEQNMLSEYASKMLLEGIFGLNGNPEADGQGFGRRGIILNGHDHEGCDTLHYVSQTEDACPPLGILNDDALGVIAPGNTNISETPEWHAVRIPTASSLPHPREPTELVDCVPYREKPHIREITLRSMMGDFSGYAGFLSAWFDESLGEKGEWKLEFSTCGVGVQHWWWAVHITDFIVLVILVFAVLARLVEAFLKQDEKKIQVKVKGTSVHIEQVEVRKKSTENWTATKERKEG